MTDRDVSSEIESAISKVMATQEGYQEGDLLVEWVVVAYVTNPDKEEGDAYPIFYSNGEIPTYRARGLLHTGLKLMEE